jgi:hypothetical protein
MITLLAPFFYLTLMKPPFPRQINRAGSEHWKVPAGICTHSPTADPGKAKPLYPHANSSCLPFAVSGIESWSSFLSSV